MKFIMHDQLIRFQSCHIWYPQNILAEKDKVKQICNYQRDFYILQKVLEKKFTLHALLAYYIYIVTRLLQS